MNNDIYRVGIAKWILKKMCYAWMICGVNESKYFRLGLEFLISKDAFNVKYLFVYIAHCPQKLYGTI